MDFDFPVAVILQVVEKQVWEVTVVRQEHHLSSSTKTADEEEFVYRAPLHEIQRHGNSLTAPERLVKTFQYP